MSVRVRYAPSPTGSPHVGNIRTALFCHLFAKHHGGQMMLRIEDTDRTRYVPGCEEEIEESIRWMGIEWHEGPDKGGPFGPYRQSERKELGIYDKYSQILLDQGNAYWAFDTSEELTEMREFQQINKQPIGYFGGIWRDATPAQVEEAKAAGKPGVIRLKMPRGKKLVIQDAIRKRIEFDAEEVDDPVLIKADGMPTYHFAAMVDDHLMETTHIIRGEEWISSAPKHVWLFEAFGWTPPEFVHVPVIKGKDGAKLSKRHGDTRCLDYRAAGYLPGALANFIALIGWAPGGDRELMSMDEMAEAFDLDGLQPSPGVFDPDKLKWMNGNYIRQMSPTLLVKEVADYASSPESAEYWAAEARAEEKTGAALKLLAKAAREDETLVSEAITLEQERVTTLAEFGEACQFFLVEEPEMDEKSVEKWFGQEHVPALFDNLKAFLDNKKEISVEECETFLRNQAEVLGQEKLGPIVHPTRVALTGKTVGPGLFELMSVLGPDRMIRRIDRALGMLG
ncbi:MAG: glutamate--tRNA ligase [Fimbriimonadaceae bacterium]|nr:glutamate--tRNA ligase [Fimbriimonadaceae bacterium]